MMSEDRDIPILRDWLIDRMKDDAPVQEMISGDDSGMIAVRTVNGTLLGIRIFPVALTIDPLDKPSASRKKASRGKKTVTS